MKGAEGAPRLGGRILAVILFTAFFTVAALAHVWVRLQVVRLGYQISDETEREKDILQKHRKLEVEKALLRSPERLERLAVEKLRLVMPDPSIIHELGRHAQGSSGRRPAEDRTSVAGSQGSMGHQGAVNDEQRGAQASRERP